MYISISVAYHLHLLASAYLAGNRVNENEAESAMAINGRIIGVWRLAKKAIVISMTYRLMPKAVAAS
jgi:hypothetical protein